MLVIGVAGADAVAQPVSSTNETPTAMRRRTKCQRLMPSSPWEPVSRCCCDARVVVFGCTYRSLSLACRQFCCKSPCKGRLFRARKDAQFSGEEEWLGEQQCLTTEVHGGNGCCGSHGHRAARGSRASTAGRQARRAPEHDHNAAA